MQTDRWSKAFKAAREGLEAYAAAIAELVDMRNTRGEEALASCRADGIQGPEAQARLRAATKFPEEFEAYPSTVRERLARDLGDHHHFGPLQAIAGR